MILWVAHITNPRTHFIFLPLVMKLSLSLLLSRWTPDSTSQLYYTHSFVCCCHSNKCAWIWSWRAHCEHHVIIMKSWYEANQFYWWLKGLFPGCSRTFLPPCFDWLQVIKNLEVEWSYSDYGWPPGPWSSRITCTGHAGGCIPLRAERCYHAVLF